MSILVWPNRDPHDVNDFGIDGWLVHLGGGDKVVSATWTVSPEGPTLGPDAVSADGDETSTWIAGGTAGTSYVYTCHAVTEQGRHIDRSARQFVVDR